MHQYAHKFSKYSLSIKKSYKHLCSTILLLNKLNYQVIYVIKRLKTYTVSKYICMY